jgi:ABC-type antimicrobial peptide transport system permease subunit
MALGAKPSDVMSLVLRRAALLAGMGLAVGSVPAVFVSRLVGSMLFGLKPGDPGTWATVLAAVAAIALLAAAGPAWRASRIDPMAALREE